MAFLNVQQEHTMVRIHSDIMKLMKTFLHRLEFARLYNPYKKMMPSTITPM